MGISHASGAMYVPILLVLGSVSAGCKSEEQSAVSQLKRMAGETQVRCDQALEVAYRREPLDRGGPERWGRIRVTCENVRFDVRHTDSAVSPLSGIISVDETLWSHDADYPTKQSAITSKAKPYPHEPETQEAVYAWQDGRWVPANENASKFPFVDASPKEDEDSRRWFTPRLPASGI